MRIEKKKNFHTYSRRSRLNKCDCEADLNVQVSRGTSIEPGGIQNGWLGSQMDKMREREEKTTPQSVVPWDPVHHDKYCGNRIAANGRTP